ncbi:MAG: M81 family metallopeptidase [Chloroflexota bacterium]
MKVFVGGVATETNTFSPMPTGAADFAVIRPSNRDDNALGGDVVNVLEAKTAERGWDFVFSLYCFAQPAGITVRKAYEDLRDEMLGVLQENLPVDIVLMPLHGAMVAEGYDDCETDMIQRVREIVGPDTIIGVELDLHCDVTQEMVDTADAIVIYKEYPHIDINDRAIELFDICADAAEGKIKPTMSLFDCRMIGMYLTPFEPMRTFVDEMMAAEGKDGILSLSLAHCFPWGDVPTEGSYMLAITDNNQAQADTVAEAWGHKFFELRYDVQVPCLSLDDALDKALAIETNAETGPVVVADQADNAGGGAPSDSTFVLRALLERGAKNVAIAMFWDPIVVQVVKSAGVGATLDLRLGGKMGPMSGDPLDITATVTGITDDMIQNWPQTEGAKAIACGDSVALHCQGIDIIVNSKRSQVFSPEVFSNLGVDPLSKQLLVVKSTQHFYAGFAPIAKEIIYMATSGSVAPLFKEIPYQRVDMSKFPWVENPFGED